MRGSFALSPFCPQLRARPATECVPRARSRARLRTACGPPLTPPMSNRHSPSVKPRCYLAFKKSRAEGGRFHFIGSVEPFPREMWMLTRYWDPADLDKDGNLDQVQVSRSNKISDSSRYSRRCRERASCACGCPTECFPHSQGSVFDREDLHTPGTCPAGRTQGLDHAGQVEHPFAAVAAPVNRVFEQRADDQSVRIVEFDADDAMQRNGSELRDRGMSTLDVPCVDDDTCSGVSRVLDELQSVAQRLDVRPGEELDSQPRAGVLRLGCEFGELGGPVLTVPRRVISVGRHLDVPGAQYLRGPEQVMPDAVRLHPLRSVIPPVRNSLELEVRHAVVVEHGPDAAQPVFPLGRRKIRRQQAETAESRC